MARSVRGGSAERLQQSNNEAPAEATQQQDLKHEEPQANDHEGDKLDGAFVLDGDQFFDAREIESTPAVVYWGMEIDKQTNRVYFFNHLAPAETQWNPPAAIVDSKTQDVLLWDASAQWFYLYCLQNGESRWVDDEEYSESQPQVYNEHVGHKQLELDAINNAFRQ